MHETIESRLEGLIWSAAAAGKFDIGQVFYEELRSRDVKRAQQLNKAILEVESMGEL